MDIFDKDVFVDPFHLKAYKMRLKFEDGATESPNYFFDKVKELTKKRYKEMGETVGRLGDILVGQRNNPLASFGFAMGWYFRKGVESAEKVHGKCEIQFETQKISKEQMLEYVSELMKRDAERIVEYAEEISRAGLPSGYDDEEEEPD